jgi:fatty acid desaturase
MTAQGKVPVSIINTIPRRNPGAPRTTSEFTALTKRIKEEGLLQRTLGFYARKFAFWITVLAATIVASVFVGESWWQLALALPLGISLTQMAFMAHETAHRQVFATNKANDRVGMVLANFFAGLSYDWWMSKHTRHHANPNLEGKDPDIAIRGLVFTTEQAKAKTGLWGFIARHQGWLFFPLLTLTVFDLLTSSAKVLFATGGVKHRGREIALLVAHYGVLIALPFVFLPPLIAGGFVVIAMMVFGFYMGISFAPNHKGMPILAKESKVDFLSRQVLTSRNVKPNWFVDNMMGGLNYQIEHHLFPSMSRPHLKRAKEIVQEYCAEKKIKYTETSMFKSWGIVVSHLNKVGLSARDPFECPIVAQYRRTD